MVAPSGWKAPSDTAQHSSSCCPKSSWLPAPIPDQCHQCSSLVRFSVAGPPITGSPDLEASPLPGDPTASQVIPDWRRFQSDRPFVIVAPTTFSPALFLLCVLRVLCGEMFFDFG